MNMTWEAFFPLPAGKKGGKGLLVRAESKEGKNSCRSPNRKKRRAIKNRPLLERPKAKGDLSKRRPPPINSFPMSRGKGKKTKEGSTTPPALGL